MATTIEEVILSISADTSQIKRALQRLTGDTKQATTTIEGEWTRVDKAVARTANTMQKGGQQITTSLRQVRAQTTNLGFQLNDISQGLMSGTSPFTLMVQQGSQVSQIMQQIGGGGGIRAGISALGGAFMQMVHPVSLLTMALIYAAGSAVKYFTSVDEGSKEAEAAYKAESDLLQRVADQWGELVPAIKEAAEERRKALQQEQKQEATDITIQEGYDKLLPLLGPIEEGLKDINREIAARGGTEEARANLRELILAWEALEEAQAKGLGTTAEVQRVEAALGAVIDVNDQKYADLIDRLGELEAAYRKEGATALRTRQESNKATEEARELQKQLTDAMKEMHGIAAAQLTNAEKLIQAYKDALVAAGELTDKEARRMTAAGATAEYVAGKQRLYEQGTTTEPSAAKEFLKTKAANQAIADSLDRLDSEMATALAKLFHLLPEAARITSGVRTYAEQARLRADFEAGRGGLAAPAGHSRHEMGTFREGGAAVDIGQGVAMRDLREAVKLVPELEQLKDENYERDKVHVQLAGESARLEKANAEALVQSEQDRAKATERRLEQQREAQAKLEKMISTEQQEIALKERINVINANLSLTENERALAIARVTAEAAKEAEVERLLAQAREAGLAITPQLIAQYNALAQAKVNAVITNQQLAISERDTVKATEEQRQAQKELAEQITQMGQSAIGGLVNDLRNGVSEGEAFNNMLNRILDSLIQMSLQSLFSQQGLGGLIGGLVGVKHAGGRVDGPGPMRMVPRDTFLGARRMARGGFVGVGPGEVPIIAHRGELVIPRNMLRRAPGGGQPTTVTNNLGDIDIDMSATGKVAANGDDAKAFGLRVQKAVQLIMVQESRPGGLLRQAGATR